MIPGSLATFTNTTIQIVADAFESYRDRELSISNWEMTLWTEPRDTDPQQTVARVFALRSDGLSPEAIAERQERTAARSETPESAILAPARQSWPKPPDYPARPSKVGWERMMVGERIHIRCMFRDLRFLINKAVNGRDLAWEFRATRCRDMEPKGSTTPTWLVERIV